MRNATLFLFLAIIVGGALVWWGRVEDPETIELVVAPQTGGLAPALELTDLNGTQHSLADYKGQPLIINFWATWCPPCRAEMPALEAVHDKYEEDGLVVLAVNAGEDPATIRQFADNVGLHFPILLDTRGAAIRAYQVQSFPSTYFVDRQGQVRATEFSGPMSQAFIESQVSRILK